MALSLSFSLCLCLLRSCAVRLRSFDLAFALRCACACLCISCMLRVCCAFGSRVCAGVCVVRARVPSLFPSSFSCPFFWRLSSSLLLSLPSSPLVLGDVMAMLHPGWLHLERGLDAYGSSAVDASRRFHEVCCLLLSKKNPAPQRLPACSRRGAPRALHKGFVENPTHAAAALQPPWRHGRRKQAPVPRTAAAERRGIVTQDPRPQDHRSAATDVAGPTPAETLV